MAKLAKAQSEDEFIRAASQIVLDPASFARHFLGHTIWDLQEQIMQAVAKNPLVCVKACHASGKTFVAAQLTLWWLARHPGTGIVITTAPTWPQVEALLWAEIHTAVAKSVWPYPNPTKTQMHLGPKNYARGLSTDEAERFQGFHGDVLIIVDEAPGVRQALFQAIDGIRAGGKVHVLLLGNPTIPGGAFFEAFKSPLWEKFTIDAFDTPNLYGVTEDDIAALPEDPNDLTREQAEWLAVCPFPYLTTRQWVWEKYNHWKPESPIYQARVRGRFPTDSDEMMFPFYLVENARALKEEDPGAPISAGLDIAGPGEDETVLYWRRALNIKGLHTWRIPDAKHAVTAAIKRIQAQTVNADSGGLGYHLFTHLRDHKIAARPIVAQSSPRDKDRFLNLKAEMYWDFRMALDAQLVGGLTDGATIDQLLTVLYDDSTGKVAVESKKVARKGRGIKSPDRAEALIMSFAENVIPPLRCY